MTEVDMGTSKSLANKQVEIVAHLEKHRSWRQKRGRQYTKFGKKIFSISVLLSTLSLKWEKNIVDSSIKFENIFKSSFTLVCLHQVSNFIEFIKHLCFFASLAA